MIGDDNRILQAARRLQERLDTGVKPDGSPITGDLEALEESLDLDALETFAYQSAQARAHATGKLTTAEAQTIYLALGGEGFGRTASGWADGVSLALKVTITNLMAELLTKGLPR